MQTVLEIFEINKENFSKILIWEGFLTIWVFELTLFNDHNQEPDKTCMQVTKVESLYRQPISK